MASPPRLTPLTSSSVASPSTIRSVSKGKEHASRGKRRDSAGNADNSVMVGNLIGEDHVNYVLMYNMLTGIRIGVSRCQAKIKRPLTDLDFQTEHKFSFDFTGNELTPSAKYDFKFKDYAPWVFRSLREDYFHLDPADYLVSLTEKYILSELGSPGKSGSFFYFSRDYKYIIKTIHKSEHKFLCHILKDYYQHVQANPHTLLSRFYGLHRVKLPHGSKIHFVIMNNLFPPHLDIHATYDLKGSTIGRDYPEEKLESNPSATMKDLNWIRRNKRLDLGPEKRMYFLEQMKRDVELLKRLHIMDYSLLIGLHDMKKGNHEKRRQDTLTVFHPEAHSEPGASPTASTPRRRPSISRRKSEVKQLRLSIRRQNPVAIEAVLPADEDQSDVRRHFIFYADEGGMRATDENNENLDEFIYAGIIDICTPYNAVKRLEHFWKGLSQDKNLISPVPPLQYGQRFVNFLQSIMAGVTETRIKTE